MSQGERVKLVGPPAWYIIKAAAAAKDEAEFIYLCLPLEVATQQAASDTMWERTLAARAAQLHDVGLAEAMKMATYAEVVALLSTVSLEHPLHGGNFRMYTYAFVETFRADVTAADVVAEMTEEARQLQEYELAYLEGLRRSIRRHQLDAVKRAGKRNCGSSATAAGGLHHDEDVELAAA